MPGESITLPEAVVFGDIPITEVGVIRYAGEGLAAMEARAAELRAKLEDAPDTDAAPIAEALERLEALVLQGQQCRDNPIVYAVTAAAPEPDEDPLTERFREVLMLLVDAQQQAAAGDPDDFLSPAEMSDDELIFQATLRLPASMAADVARLNPGLYDDSKSLESCKAKFDNLDRRFIRFDMGETPALGYPADGGLKAQVRPFEETLSVGTVIAQGFPEVFPDGGKRPHVQQFSVSRELAATDELRRQQQASQDQAAFQGGV